MLTPESIILIGGGGHCRSVIDVIESEGLFQIKGIIDKKELVGQQVLGYKIIGTDNDLPAILKEYQHFHITIGHIQTSMHRKRLFEQVKSIGGILPVIKSPNAYISKHASIGEGSIIMHQAFINANANIGQNCIINTSSVIEHDVTIEDHCHISTGAFINGECTVGHDSFVGSQSTVIQCVKVAHGNLIAAGSVITKDTIPGSLYAGNPATLKKQISE